MSTANKTIVKKQRGKKPLCIIGTAKSSADAPYDLKIDDDYMRERIIDITDINKRLIGNLRKIKSCPLSDIDKEVIVFADDLTPSETAVMNKEFILAFVTDKGGKTSHTAIMAKALEIPAIVATKIQHH